ncbi:lipopolysaccharide biosynthesis protein [Haemophilus influenzae NT127]|nr:lipopolysaccharide biosynthesis protein [Haemophilus influenzae NT127]
MMLIIFLNVEITLKSLLMHNENLSVFILHTGDISESWQNDLQLYFAKRYSTLQLVHMISINTLDISPVIFHFTGPHKPLDNIFSENTYVNAVISLFRLYASISWQDICSLPLGTTRANWINQER